MMKKLLLLAFFFSLFVSINLHNPSKASAFCLWGTECSCVDQFGMAFVGSPPPTNVGSDVDSINFYLKTLQGTAVGKTYQLYARVNLPSSSEIEVLLAEASPTKLDEAFEYQISKETFSWVFESDVSAGYAKSFIVKEKGTDNTCKLWNYKTYSTPVSATGNVCNAMLSGTRDKCSAEGGCQQGYKCKEADSVWGCFADVPVCGATNNGEPTEPVLPELPETPTRPVYNGEEAPTPVVPAQPVTQPTGLKCGEKTTSFTTSCSCTEASSTLKPIGAEGYCCGWALNGKCYGTVENFNAALKIATGDTTVAAPVEGPVTSAPTQPGSGGGGDTTTEETTENSSGMDIFAGPNNADFKELNPLRGNASLSSPGGILSRILMFAFPLAGLILFTMLVWGGFEMLVGATGKGIDAGKQRVTNAIIGFFLLFISYWVFQIVEVIFGLQIL